MFLDSPGTADILVDIRYYKLLRRLPCPRYLLAHDATLGKVLLLRFQGGEGLLMPIGPS